MKPIKLKISGLNSFIEAQEVDFERLTERGLFGIFGPTGSGKSTILDAITLAMYGKIARNTKEFINVQSNSASISYEFEIGMGSERKRYIVDRNIKKDIKSGGYKTALARLREVTADEERVLGEGEREVQKKITEIIGLTAEDFTRSVVLPQGKFNDFLKLTGLERRNMLERIFNLENYGNKLVKKIREVRNEKYDIMNRITGELARFDGVSEQALDEIRERLYELLKEEKKLREEKKTIEKDYEKAKAIWDKQEELRQYTKRKELLDKTKEEIQYKKEKLKKSERALSVKPFIDSLSETETKIQNNEKELINLTDTLNKIEEKLITTEKEYNLAFDKKDKEIPVLIEKETRLKHALKIQMEINKLKAEREALLNDYKLNEVEIEKYKKELDKLTKEIDAAKTRLNQIEERTRELKISSLYREEIFAAFDIEKEYDRVSKEKKEKEEKAKYLKNDIDKEREEHNLILSLISENEQKIQSLNNKLKNLEENSPGGSESLLLTQQQLEDIKRKLSEALENDKKRTELENILNEVSKLRLNSQEHVNKLVKAIADKNAELENTRCEIEKAKMMNMAGILAKELRDGMPCPVCGSVHHLKLAEKYDDEELRIKVEAEKNLTKEIEELQRELMQEQANLSGYKTKEEMHKIELKDLLKKLSGLDLKALEKSVKKSQSDFEALKHRIESWNKEKLDMEDSLKRLKDERAELNSKEAALRESLNKDNAAFNETVNALISIEQKYIELRNAYREYKEKLDIVNIQEKINEINKNEKEIEQLQKEQSALKAATEKYLNQKENIESKLNELMIKKAKITEIGKEKAKYIEDRQIEMAKLSEDKEPQKYLEDIKKQREEILKAEETLKNKLENERKQKQDIENKKAAAIENGITLKNILDSQLLRLNNALLENNFRNVEEAISCLMPKETMKLYEDEIKSYENEYIALSDNIERIKVLLDGRYVDEKMWENLQNRLKEIEDTINRKAMEIGAMRKALEDIEKNLKTVTELTKQKNELMHIIDMLDDLDKLVQGNKFVEFVAMSQLKYIALAASKRLKEITRGRYALELDSSGNFVMRDDFNGGTRRSADTLSGGETFLTSLSLALALSSQIQLKGNAPLEFFFLDEGFGTLDSELLDVVMSSLERLHNDRMCVGIISHVEEIKNRVPVKLVVTPADKTGEGSKIRIEYS